MCVRGQLFTEACFHFSFSPECSVFRGLSLIFIRAKVCQGALLGLFTSKLGRKQAPSDLFLPKGNTNSCILFALYNMRTHMLLCPSSYKNTADPLWPLESLMPMGPTVNEMLLRGGAFCLGWGKCKAQNGPHADVPVCLCNVGMIWVNLGRSCIIHVGAITRKEFSHGYLLCNL